MSDRVHAWGARLLQSRTFVRAPIPLFRAGLGFLLTRRLLMLEHVGRTSEQARYVVLEVVREESPGALVVASGFGRTSQWFRNVVAEPRCHVSIGFTRRRPAVATVLGAAESEAALADYQQAHPGSWEDLSAIIRKATGEADPEIPLVRLQLQAARSTR
ncbi:nitroreductase family deazaflavin-dependent oxidoreductase [Ornithinimicrobium cryptoxanthini]|uniref:nitroreductase family deazaflavin-dependent oxidoreductase n=1 Tax=Ornithinimicrobium cryptoxanthini TaxID=2934161 RepID=UPI0021175B15|nr:nitroreductase family deazaflavin-dependent oxidoreductase [Ornithinimicrobium cryptoxanthini]